MFSDTPELPPIRRIFCSRVKNPASTLLQSTEGIGERSFSIFKTQFGLPPEICPPQSMGFLTQVEKQSMSKKRYKPEEIVSKLCQVDVLKFQVREMRKPRGNAFIWIAIATTIPTATLSALAEIPPTASHKSPAPLFHSGRYLPASYDQATHASATRQ